MWLKKKNPSKEADTPEKVRYSHYYEHDGILRAYANRAMVLAFLCIPITMVALAFAVYVRLQPPTVIRVDENGLATVPGATKPGISVTQGLGSEPSEFEKRAFVRLFLESKTIRPHRNFRYVLSKPPRTTHSPTRHSVSKRSTTFMSTTKP
jgi:hypothetical protein